MLMSEGDTFHDRLTRQLEAAAVLTLTTVIITALMNCLLLASGHRLELQRGRLMFFKKAAWKIDLGRRKEL